MNDRDVCPFCSEDTYADEVHACPGLVANLSKRIELCEALLVAMARGHARPLTEAELPIVRVAPPAPAVGELRLMAYGVDVSITITDADTNESLVSRLVDEMRAIFETRVQEVP